MIIADWILMVNADRMWYLMSSPAFSIEFSYLYIQKQATSEQMKPLNKHHHIDNGHRWKNSPNRRHCLDSGLGSEKSHRLPHMDA
jgi:hypothetical protein